MRAFYKVFFFNAFFKFDEMGYKGHEVLYIEYHLRNNLSGHRASRALDGIRRTSAKPKMLANSSFSYLLHFLIYIIF
ncbi:hypothetical protein NEOC65_001646 [Neochlamydia sp. AcF65]|nr:hypothetical protein [Neochlamydia sp. AcF65]